MVRYSLSFLIIILVNQTVFGDQPKPMDFEFVARFEQGDGDVQLGVNPRALGPDLAGPIVPWGPDAWLIYDNVNGRLVKTDSRWHTLKVYQPLYYLQNVPPDHWPTNFGPTNLVPFVDGILLWDSTDSLPSWLSLNGKTQNFAEGVLSVTGQYRRYNFFLFRFGDTFIFQYQVDGGPNTRSGFFGLKDLAPKGGKQVYLDDNAVRKLLADPKNKRYQIKGKAIFDRGQILSADSDTLLQYFKTRISTPTDSSSALANGLYFFSSYLQASIVDERGNTVIETELLVRDQDLAYSKMFPAPDGYIYQFRGDYKAAETRLYRIGPFPEINLDYHGKGGTINDDNVNLREEPNTKSKAVIKLSKGTPVRILSQTDESETIAGQAGIWYQVRLWDRSEGWVFGAFLDIAK